LMGSTCKRLAAIVTPHLLSLHEYTGYNFTLLAGRVDRTGPKPEFQVTGYVWIYN
jgi:hypothetical protein